MSAVLGFHARRPHAARRSHPSVGRVWAVTMLGVVVGCGARVEVWPGESAADGGASALGGASSCPDTRWPCSGGGGGECSNDLSADPHNCGACGVECGAAECANGTCAAKLETVWSLPIEGEQAAVDWDGVRDIAAAPDGGVFVVANQWGAGQSPDTTVLMRLDAQQEEMWTVPLEPYAVNLASRDLSLFVLSEGPSSSSLTARVDPEGTTLWSVAALTASEGTSPLSVAASWGGEALAAGSYFDDSMTSTEVGFVSRVSEAGDVYWTQSIAATEGATVESVTATPSGGLVATIHYAGTLSVNGVGLVTSVGSDVAVVAWEADEPIWAISLDTAGEARVTSDRDGNVLVAHTNEGALTIDKLDENGQTQWSRTLGPGIVDAIAITTDFAGNVVVGGTFQDVLEVGDDVLVAQTDPYPMSQVFVLKLDPAGKVLVSRTLPFWYSVTWWGADFEPVSLASDAMGNVFVGAGACFENGSAVTKLTP